MYQEGIRIALSGWDFEKRATGGQAHAGQQPVLHAGLPFGAVISSLVDSLAASLAASVLLPVSQVRAEI